MKSRTLIIYCLALSMLSQVASAQLKGNEFFDCRAENGYMILDFKEKAKGMPVFRNLNNANETIRISLFDKDNQIIHATRVYNDDGIFRAIRTNEIGVSQDFQGFYFDVSKVIEAGDELYFKLLYNEQISEYRYDFYLINSNGVSPKKGPFGKSEGFKNLKKELQSSSSLIKFNVDDNCINEIDNNITNIREEEEKKKIDEQRKKAREVKEEESKMKIAKINEERAQNLKVKKGELLFLCNRGTVCQGVVVQEAGNKVKLELIEQCHPQYSGYITTRLYINSGQQKWISKTFLYKDEPNCNAKNGPF